MKRIIWIFLTSVTLLGLACSTMQKLPVGATDSNRSLETGSLTFTLLNGDDLDTALSLGKKVTDSVEHIWITIKEVQIHIAADTSENGWKTVATPNKRFDFLTLVDGLTAPLDLFALPAGHYTQIRLLLGDEVQQYYMDASSGPANAIVVKGATYPLTIPSSFQTGIKCVRSFVIAKNEVTEICLAFDVRKAVHYAPGNGWMMKPAFRTYKCGGSSDATDKKNKKDTTATDTTNVIQYPLG